MTRIAGLGVMLALFGASVAPRAAYAQKREDIKKPAQLLGVDLSRADILTLDQKKYAKGVAEKMVCLCGTCPKEPLSTCDCGWAGNGRKMIGLALLDGRSEQDVLDAFKKSFGAKAFAAPPEEVQLMVTVVPFMLVAAMLLAFVAFGIANRRQGKPAPVPVKKDEPVVPGDEAARILRRELEEMD
ncbi:MAG: cytochrome c-type biogenesis protein CcmH [Myxococcota bacterium]